MRPLLARLLPCLAVAAFTAGARAGDEPFAFPTMEAAQRVQQRHLRLDIQGKPAGGVSGRLGHLADGRRLFELRSAIQMRRSNAGQEDLFKISGEDTELSGADGRLLASRSVKTEAGVVESTECVYGEKHVDVAHTGPGGTYRKQFELPADFGSDAQAQRTLIAGWKEGEKPRRTYSVFDGSEQRFQKHETTLLGKTAFEHDGVKHPAWRFRTVDDQKMVGEWLVDVDLLPLEISLMGGAMKATWVNEPTLDLEGAGWSLTSMIEVDQPIERMLELESLEVRLAIDPLPTADEPPVAVAGTYQDVAADPKGVRLTLKAQRVPEEAAALALPVPTDDPAVRRYLAPTPAAQSDHAEIVAEARRLAEGEGGALGAVRRIVGWVWANVEKVGGARGTATALEVLQSKRGDCSEHAVLVVALCRAAGIPARAVGGIEYLSSKDKAVAGFHAWSEVWLGRWVPVDATIPEVGTSARYVHMHTSEPGEASGAAALASLVVKKVRLEVLAWTHQGKPRVEAPRPVEPARAPEPVPAGPK